MASAEDEVDFSPLDTRLKLPACCRPSTSTSPYRPRGLRVSVRQRPKSAHASRASRSSTAPPVFGSYASLMRVQPIWPRVCYRIELNECDVHAPSLLLPHLLTLAREISDSLPPSFGSSSNRGRNGHSSRSLTLRDYFRRLELIVDETQRSEPDCKLTPRILLRYVHHLTGFLYTLCHSTSSPPSSESLQRRHHLLFHTFSLSIHHFLLLPPTRLPVTQRFLLLQRLFSLLPHCSPTPSVSNLTSILGLILADIYRERGKLGAAAGLLRRFVRKKKRMKNLALKDLSVIRFGVACVGVVGRGVVGRRGGRRRRRKGKWRKRGRTRARARAKGRQGRVNDVGIREAKSELVRLWIEKKKRKVSEEETESEFPNQLMIRTEVIRGSASIEVCHVLALVVCSIRLGEFIEAYRYSSETIRSSSSTSPPLPRLQDLVSHLKCFLDRQRKKKLEEEQRRQQQQQQQQLYRGGQQVRRGRIIETPTSVLFRPSPSSLLGHLRGLFLSSGRRGKVKRTTTDEAVAAVTRSTMPRIAVSSPLHNLTASTSPSFPRVMATLDPYRNRNRIRGGRRATKRMLRHKPTAGSQRRQQQQQRRDGMRDRRKKRSTSPFTTQRPLRGLLSPLSGTRKGVSSRSTSTNGAPMRSKRSRDSNSMMKRIRPASPSHPSRVSLQTPSALSRPSADRTITTTTLSSTSLDLNTACSPSDDIDEMEVEDVEDNDPVFTSPRDDMIEAKIRDDDDDDDMVTIVEDESDDELDEESDDVEVTPEGENSQSQQDITPEVCDNENEDEENEKRDIAATSIQRWYRQRIASRYVSSLRQSAALSFSLYLRSETLHYSRQQNPLTLRRLLRQIRQNTVGVNHTVLLRGERAKELIESTQTLLQDRYGNVRDFGIRMVLDSEEEGGGGEGEDSVSPKLICRVIEDSERSVSSMMIQPSSLHRVVSTPEAMLQALLSPYSLLRSGLRIRGNQLNAPILVIVGPRRSGKSVVIASLCKLFPACFVIVPWKKSIEIEEEGEEEAQVKEAEGKGVYSLATNRCLSYATSLRSIVELRSLEALIALKSEAARSSQKSVVSILLRPISESELEDRLWDDGLGTEEQYNDSDERYFDEEMEELSLVVDRIVTNGQSVVETAMQVARCYQFFDPSLRDWPSRRLY